MGLDGLLSLTVLTALTLLHAQPAETACTQHHPGPTAACASYSNEALPLPAVLMPGLCSTSRTQAMSQVTDDSLMMQWYMCRCKAWLQALAQSWAPA